VRRGGLRRAARHKETLTGPPVRRAHQVPRSAARRRAAALVQALPLLPRARSILWQPQVCACLALAACLSGASARLTRLSQTSIAEQYPRRAYSRVFHCAWPQRPAVRYMTPYGEVFEVLVEAHPLAAGAVQPASTCTASRSASIERAAPVRPRVSRRHVSVRRARPRQPWPCALAMRTQRLRPQLQRTLCVTAQASLNVSQVRRGRAAGDADAALTFSDHEAAPALPPAERVRHVGGAAVARSHCRMAADNATDTSGSVTSGSEDSASESDRTAGAGLHAGGQPGLLPAVLPCCAAGPKGVCTGGRGRQFCAGSPLNQHARALLCAFMTSA